MAYLYLEIVSMSIDARVLRLTVLRVTFSTAFLHKMMFYLLMELFLITFAMKIEKCKNNYE